jgi:hypothetical protein
MPSPNIASRFDQAVDGDRVRRARRIARAAGGFELKLLGRLPRSVAVVDGAGLTVVTIHTGLSEIERRLSSTGDGERRVLRWHRSLVAASFDALREHLHEATGLMMTAVATHVDVATGSLLKTCTTAAAIDLVVLGGNATGFGVAVDEHLHVDDADGNGSVRRNYSPEGIHVMKKVPYAGIDEKASRERGDRSA